MAVVCRLQRALSRLSINIKQGTLYSTADSNYSGGLHCLSIPSARNYSRYANSPLVEDVTDRVDYEVVKNPPEWKFVERLLPLQTVPKIKEKSSYPSGYLPSKPEAADHPYFITRTRNHMLPIYLNLTFRGQRRISLIKKIDGDIWQLNDELKQYLQNKYNKIIATRVHELLGTIEVKGDYVIDLRNWAYSKGF